MTDLLQDTVAANAAVEQFLTNGDAPAAPEYVAPESGFVRLPGGYTRGGLSADVTYDVEVRELTGVDEEYLDRVKRGKPEKFLETLVERGLVAIGDTKANKGINSGLLVGDVEKILIEIRRATYGDTLEYEGLTCPHCADKFDLAITLDDIPVTALEKSEDREFTVSLRKGGTAFCHLPRLGDMPSVSNDATDAEVNTAMLANVIDRIEDKGNTILVGGAIDPARNLSLADRQSILRELAKRKIGPDLNAVTFTHDVCQKEVPFPLSTGDLFPGL